MSRRLIIDTPETDREAARVEHSDLPDIAIATLRAEQDLLKREFAELTWKRRRGGFVARGEELIPVVSWIGERLRAIATELVRREHERKRPAR